MGKRYIPRSLILKIYDKNNEEVIECKYDSKKDKFIRTLLANKLLNYIIPKEGNWDDIIFFLESRVMSKRQDYKEDLKLLNLSKWDLFEIIEKTNGRMFKDEYWIKIEYL